jgi:hypothetical protein
MHQNTLKKLEGADEVSMQLRGLKDIQDINPYMPRFNLKITLFVT